MARYLFYKAKSRVIGNLTFKVVFSLFSTFSFASGVSFNVLQHTTSVDVWVTLDTAIFLQIYAPDENNLRFEGPVFSDTHLTIVSIPRDTLDCRIHFRWVVMNFVQPPDVQVVSSNIVRIPGGWYKIGADDNNVSLLEILGAESDFIDLCTPASWVFVDTFEITRTEISCALFNQFISSGGYSDSTFWELGNQESISGNRWEGWQIKQSSGWISPDVPCLDDSLPVRGVSYYEAIAFAHYLGGTLPTEAQWEVSARLSTGAIFPWGNQFCASSEITANLADFIQCSPDTFGGGPGTNSFFAGDVSPTGCLSMGGNLSEWCLDVFSSLYYDNIDPLAPFVYLGDTRKSVRGGNFVCDDRRDATVFNRVPFAPNLRDGILGFRVVWNTSDGVPNNWQSLSLNLDCSAPETDGVILPRGCLLEGMVDSVGIVFSEPVVGGVVLSPVSIGVTSYFSISLETLWVRKDAYAISVLDSLCIDLSGLADTVGNPIGLSGAEFCFPICAICMNLSSVPETLWAPQGCSARGIFTIGNCSSYPIHIDSVEVSAPFDIEGFCPVISQSGICTLSISFLPNCAGVLSSEVLVFAREGMTRVSVLGIACQPPIVQFIPVSIDFGDISDTVQIFANLDFNDCTRGSLEVCHIRWSSGANFSTGVSVGDIYYSDTTIWVTFMPTGFGYYEDTLFLEFRPLNGECCPNANAMLVVKARNSPLSGEPDVDYDAVTTGDVVTFSYISDRVDIYDRYGRFVIRLYPDSDSKVRWNLLDENDNPVPSGMYVWCSGKYRGTIMVVR